MLSGVSYVHIRGSTGKGRSQDREIVLFRALVASNQRKKGKSGQTSVNVTPGLDAATPFLSAFNTVLSRHYLSAKIKMVPLRIIDPRQALR